MKKGLIAGALALALLGGMVGCASKLPAVYVQPVSQIMGYGTMGESNACAGVVIAQNEVKIERDENRKVAELKVEVGQSVAAGDVLFVYDTDEIKLTIDKAELEIEQLKNSVKDYSEQITQLEKDKKTAPESEQLSYTVRIQSLETDKKETEYNISVKERELANLKANAGNGEITAPIDGKIKAINENGGYDEMTGQPLPYITVVQSGAYRVKGKVNEMNIGEFYVGQAVILRSRVDAAQTWTGIITQIDTAPEDSNSNGMMYYGYGMSDEMTSTSSYPFYVDLDTMDGLLLGQHVYVEPNNGQTEQTDGISLYADYVLGSEEEGYYVWAANDDNEIEKRTVTVGSYDEMLNCYEITDGLTLQDRIAFPDESVQEGAPITDTMPEPSEGEEPISSDGDEAFDIPDDDMGSPEGESDDMAFSEDPVDIGGGVSDAG